VERLLTRESGLTLSIPSTTRSDRGQPSAADLEDLPDVDVVVVPVGGGGLAGGVAAALMEQHPSIRVIGVEPERSNALETFLIGPVVQ
jgi:threonine dehydratase